MLAHAPLLTNRWKATPGGLARGPPTGALGVCQRPAARGRRRVAEARVRLGRVLQHEGARGRRGGPVGQRGTERLERALMVLLPQPEGAERVEVVAARLRVSRQRAVD